MFAEFSVPFVSLCSIHFWSDILTKCLTVERYHFACIYFRWRRRWWNVHKWIFKTIECLFFHKTPFSVRAVAEFKRTKLFFGSTFARVVDYIILPLFRYFFSYQFEDIDDVNANGKVFVSFFAFELLAFARWRLAHQHNEHRNRFVFSTA